MFLMSVLMALPEGPPCVRGVVVSEKPNRLNRVPGLSTMSKSRFAFLVSVPWAETSPLLAIDASKLEIIPLRSVPTTGFGSKPTTVPVIVMKLPPTPPVLKLRRP